MRKGNLFVISGPSGVGKGTLVARLLPEIPDSWLSISATTRKPRAGEVEGQSYYFLDDERFCLMMERDEFLEWACVHGHYYGTPRATVEAAMAAGKQVILEIDVQGALQIRQTLPEAWLIFIAPPSLAELRARLEARGTENPSEIEARLQTARVELSQQGEYDVSLVNDQLNETLVQLKAFINAHAEPDEDGS